MRYLGEVDVHTSRDVEVVGEDVERDMRNDLRDLTVRETRVTHLGELGLADLALRVQYLLGESQRGSRLGIVAIPVAAGDNLFVLESDHLADSRMRGQAVVAPVFLCRQQRKLLARLGIQEPTGERTPEAKVVFQHYRRSSHLFGHIEHNAKLAL